MATMLTCIWLLSLATFLSAKDDSNQTSATTQSPQGRSPSQPSLQDSSYNGSEELWVAVGVGGVVIVGVVAWAVRRWARKRRERRKGTVDSSVIQPDPKVHVSLDGNCSVSAIEEVSVVMSVSNREDSELIINTVPPSTVLLSQSPTQTQDPSLMPPPPARIPQSPPHPSAPPLFTMQLIQGNNTLPNTQNTTPVQSARKGIKGLYGVDGSEVVCDTDCGGEREIEGCANRDGEDYAHPQDNIYADGLAEQEESFQSDPLQTIILDVHAIMMPSVKTPTKSPKNCKGDKVVVGGRPLRPPGLTNSEAANLRISQFSMR